MGRRQLAKLSERSERNPINPYHIMSTSPLSTIESFRINQSVRIISGEDWAQDWLNEIVTIVGLNRKKVGSSGWRDEVSVMDDSGFVYDGFKPDDVVAIVSEEEKEESE